MNLWPQYVFLALILLNAGVVLALHGSPRGSYSIWAYLLDAAVTVWLLYMGGFFMWVL